MDLFTQIYNTYSLKICLLLKKDSNYELHFKLYYLLTKL